MPLPSSDKIGDWDVSQLQRFISQAVLVDPPALPSSMSLDSASILGDIDIGGDFTAGGVIQALQGLATSVDSSFPASPRDGQLHILRVDVSPYVYEPMVFDSQLDKWVSLIPRWSDSNDVTDTAPQDPAWGALAGASRLHIPNGLTFYDAGLRPQTRIAGRFTKSAGTLKIRARIEGADSTDTSSQVMFTVDGTDNGGAPDFTINTSGVYRFQSAWTDRVALGGQPVKNAWWAVMEHINSGTGNTTTLQNGVLGFRWVADS